MHADLALPASTTRRIYDRDGHWTVTRSDLESALFGSGYEGNCLELPSGHAFMLCKVERESGSGRSFNLTGWKAGRLVTIYVRVS